MHESTVGNSLVERSSNEQRFASRGAGISGRLHNDHGTGTGCLGNLRGDWNDFVLSAICYADDVVLVAAAEVMVAEVIAKLKEVGLSVGAQKTHWTSHPKMIDRSTVVDGLAVLLEEVLEFVGSKVCLDGTARHAIAHRSAQANKCLAKWRHVLNSSRLPRLMRLNIGKTQRGTLFSGVRACGRQSRHKETKLRVGVRERWQT